jgi:hypothetical protein
MSEALEQLLDCPFCGSPAELQEWEERDATRWAAQANCTGCRAEGPRGYANNDLGCYDAVNDLHKKRAIAAWNKRAPVNDTQDKAALYDGLRAQAEKLGFRSLADALDVAISKATGNGLASLTELREEMLHEAAKTDSCYTCYTDQAAYIARRLTAIIGASTPPEVRTNVGSDNLSDQDRKEMDDALKEWAKSPEAAREALLETIDLKAQAGLESDNNFATRGLYLKDIRKIIKEARDAQ